MLIVRYLIIGGLVSVVDVLLAFILTNEGGVYYLWSVSVSMTISFILRFVLQKLLVFRDRSVTGVPGQLLRYSLLYVGSLAATVFLIRFFVQELGLWYVAAQVITIGTIACVSFFVYKFGVFRVVAENAEPSRKLFLIFNGRFPSEKAAALFAARSADAFVRTGYDVTLLVPSRSEVIESPYDAYGLSKDVAVTYLPTINAFKLPLPRVFAYWLAAVSFSISTLFYLLRHAHRTDCVYSNEPLPLFLASFRFSHTAYEMHDFPESKKGFFGMFLRRMEKVIIHNEWKTTETQKAFGISKERILTEPNAVDIEAFNPSYSQNEARAQLGLPEEGTVVAYTGHLYGWKGADTLAKAALAMPDISFYFVGGTPEDRATYEERYAAPNLHWVGFRPHSEIPAWQRAADILVLPNTAKEAISAHYTSPMKLYEYLASGTPIVASRIPSVEEIASDAMVAFAEADNAESFAETIREVLADHETALQRSWFAQEAMVSHTWDARAARIRDFLT
jgi:glycosyltransferase involved in cell wall biosynthesis/putative flippase GtrA